MKKVLIVVGTRPNFIKVTQFKKVAANYPNIDLKIIHTGQHYDEKMSTVFFDQFGLVPDYFMEIGAGTPNTQMAKIMLGLEKTMGEFNPDLLIVVGDVNSTFAAALTANKTKCKVAHLESGLRSLDREMPEEINRLLTDEITDHFFITEQSGIENLKKEGKTGGLHFVGNTMIDTLVAFEPQIKESSVLSQLEIENDSYVLMTMHRPRNVDTKDKLSVLVDIINSITSRMKLVFPAHPRTLKKLDEFGFSDDLKENNNLIFTEALDYFSFQKLIAHCTVVVTDSGGIQEETTFRQVPCLTLRENTERPSTLEIGSNTLVEYNTEDFEKYFEEIQNGTYKKGIIPELWDGKATERIMEIINKLDLNDENWSANSPS
jgi:UDP-N-acetylglucosamine 2-epimerase (non-hydrolysing)